MHFITFRAASRLSAHHILLDPHDRDPHDLRDPHDGSNGRDTDSMGSRGKDTDSMDNTSMADMDKGKDQDSRRGFGWMKVLFFDLGS